MLTNPMVMNRERRAIARALPLRTVAIRENLVMVGDHEMPAGRRHWRVTASAFAITDYHKTPLIWVEGDQVVGDMAVTVPKPQHGGIVASPAANEILLWFEVIRLGGMPVLRTWWARGRNVDRTQRVWRVETFNPKVWPERMKQLLQLMGWVV